MGILQCAQYFLIHQGSVAYKDKKQKFVKVSTVFINTIFDCRSRYIERTVTSQIHIQLSSDASLSNKNSKNVPRGSVACIWLKGGRDVELFSLCNLLNVCSVSIYY